jgi:hypothetical protein
MLQGYQTALGISALILAAGASRADIIVSGSFGPNGDVGFVNSPPSLSIAFGPGSQGSIYQMDGFAYADGMTWNGLDSGGPSRELTDGTPPGIAYSFNASQPTVDQLLLTYTFINNSAQALTNFQFMYFADPDIGSTYTDEWATVAGSLGFGLTGYQVGDPGLSTIFTNLDNGTLSNMNEEPATNPGDVATALGFQLNSLSIGGGATFQVLMSDDLSSIGSFSVTQHDPVYTDHTLTLSGQLVAPEPSSLALFGAGLIALVFIGRYRKSRVV